MANTFPEAFQREYDNSIYNLVRAKANVFAGKVREETIAGELTFFETLGTVTALTAPQGVAGDTPLMEPAHFKRVLAQVDHEVGVMIGKLDEAKTRVSFESSYVAEIVDALMRKRDIQAISGMLGTAATGKLGTDTADFDFANQTIAIDEGASSGMNVAKLRAIRAKFWKKGYTNSDQIYVALSGEQIADLLAEQEVGSADYNSVKALVNGEVNQFMGIEIVQCERLPFIADAGGVHLTWVNDVPQDTDANSTRACVAWVKNAVIVGKNPNIMTRVSEREDKRYNWQAYAYEGCGAVRMEEAGVILVPCLETV